MEPIPIRRISADYIRGLVDGEGTFTFSSTKGGRKTPAFAIKMHVRDKDLVERVRDFLGLRNRVYVYDHQRKDGAKRGPQAMLIVREIGQIKNKIVPFFYKNLIGNKRVQFEQWIEKFETDPMVPKSFKFIHKIYRAGFYDKNPIL